MPHTASGPRGGEVRPSSIMQFILLPQSKTKVGMLTLCAGRAHIRRKQTSQIQAEGRCHWAGLPEIDENYFGVRTAPWECCMLSAESKDRVFNPFDNGTHGCFPASKNGIRKGARGTGKGPNRKRKADRPQIGRASCRERV